MNKIGLQFVSEMERYTDRKSGREVVQLTQSGMSWHMYFTDNSFTLGDKDIIYLHADGNLRQKGDTNVFRLNLESGVRTQLTDFKSQFETTGAFTKSPDSEYLIFIGDGDLYSMNLNSGETRLLYRCPAGHTLGHPSVSFDKRYVAIAACDIPKVNKSYVGENYGGFKESFYAHKHAYLIIARMDGTGGDIVFEDTHWMGHVQFAPDTNEYITYCHEGPWNYVQQRIWMFNTITRHVKPCFAQAEDDSIGHEFWTRDGLVFFDNRGKGHDGTITSDKTQAVTMDSDGPDAIPWIGFADKECNLVRRMDLPYYCNHYHANRDNTKLVADAVEDIVLIDIAQDTPKIETLCEHNTSWRWQTVHCHPCWSWSNDKILFASDGKEEGRPQLYMVEMER